MNPVCDREPIFCISVFPLVCQVHISLRFLAVEELQQEYPERRIICIDTLAAAVGEGFLVREAAKKQREGLSIDELASWVMEHRLEVCHWFTVDTFTHLKHVIIGCGFFAEGLMNHLTVKDTVKISKQIQGQEKNEEDTDWEE